MYLVFCGSRDWGVNKGVEHHARHAMNMGEKEVLKRELRFLDPDKDVIIQGSAPGADSMAGFEADLMGFQVMPVPADWDGYGNDAGGIRNGWMRDMLVRARGWGSQVMVVAFHQDPKLGRGTRDMVNKAKEAGITTRLVGDRLQPNPDRRTSCFVLHGDEGRMLLQHRTDNAPTFPGFWGLFGGSIESGESPDQALAREAAEELGTVLPNMQNLGPHLYQLPNETIELNPYLGKLHEDLEELAGKQEEGQGLGFFTYDDLDRMSVPPQDLGVLRSCRARIKAYVKEARK